MIKLIKSTFYHEDETKKAVADFILKSAVLSMGKECAAFEEKFSKKQGRRHSVFVSSGSMANLVLLQSLLNLGHLRKGDKIALSSLTWATNVMPVIELGLEPIILDCELKNLNVSEDILEKAFSKYDFRAVFLTNVLGFCANLDKIQKFCADKKIILLEDNCESLGSKLGQKQLGNFGLASTFSSFVGHHFSTVEGGMICIDDEELFEMILLVRAHGWDRNLSAGSQAKLRKENKIDDFYARYTFYDLAYNARPTEIQGFIGQIQLDFWDEIVEKRSKNFKRFQVAAAANKDILPLGVSHLDLVSNFAMPVIFKTEELFRAYKDKFEKAEVEIRPIIAGNIARQPFFKKYVKTEFDCPNADLIHKNGFYFGNNPEMTSGEVEFLCDLL
ncbi:MAG: DegT/DnrJ/EryC1/StrS family aminotransferase [Patescibacteria group bacterium]